MLQYHTNKMRNTCKRGKCADCTCLILLVAVFAPKSVTKCDSNEMTIRCEQGKATSAVLALEAVPAMLCMIFVLALHVAFVVF